MNRSDEIRNLDEATVIAMGSNLPGAYATSRALLEAAVASLPAIGLRILARSRWWRSTAWPDPTAGDYLNGVVLVETALSARAVLNGLLGLEAAFGRRRAAVNASRTLDLDLIARGRLVTTAPQLRIPHPRARERRFVMGPLAEIAPAWTHPVTGETAADLAARALVGLDSTPLAE